MSLIAYAGLRARRQAAKAESHQWEEFCRFDYHTPLGKVIETFSKCPECPDSLRYTRGRIVEYNGPGQQPCKAVRR